MKRFEIAIISALIGAMLVFLVGATYDVTKEYPGAVSSGLKTSSAVILAEPGWLTGYQILTYNTGNVTVTIYDNATAGSGDVLAKSIVVQANLAGTFELPVPVRANQGIYCTITGTGGNAVVHYRARK